MSSIARLIIRVLPLVACGLEYNQRLHCVERGDYLRDMNCPLTPAHFMQGLLACNGANELGQLGTELSWFG